MSETFAQRMRVIFATDDSVKYVGHLDMARAWERAIRRARLPLAYTQGFNPQPRLHFAAALPVGFTGQAEVADVFLNEVLEPDTFLQQLGPALPPGIRPLQAFSVPREQPSLQSVVCGARYRVEVETDEPDEAFRQRLAGFLARPDAWRVRRRGKDETRYDLRPLVQAITYAGPCELGQACEVEMRTSPGATGRPDELLVELGFADTPRRVMRLNLRMEA